MRKPELLEPVHRRWNRVTRVLSHQSVMLWSAFGVCFWVFLINLTLAILAHTYLKTDGQEDFVRDLYRRECSVAERASLAAHADINLLSMLMLWASNLAMQLSTAPDRKAMDKAHQKGPWLVWLLLATTSVPIHFLYNSVVFNTLNADASVKREGTLLHLHEMYNVRGTKNMFMVWRRDRGEKRRRQSRGSGGKSGEDGKHCWISDHG